MNQNKNSYKQWPTEKGYFGKFGGRYVSETLMPLIEEVEAQYNNIKNEISEYIFMAYESNFEILTNFQNIFFKLGKNYETSLIFDEYLKNYSKIYNDDINRHIYSFIKSNKIKHYKFDNKYY